MRDKAKSLFNAAVTTPNGVGLLQGQDTDGRLLVSHRPQDVPEAVRKEYGRGGPCFSVYYSADEVVMG